MPSDVFWTGLFTFGGGLVGATGTAVGARFQYRVQARQLEIEQDRHRSEETHRDRQDRAAALEKRKSIYLNYLGALDALIHATADGHLDQDGLAQIWAAFQGADAELELAASKEVQGASYQLHAEARKIGTFYKNTLDDPSKMWPNDAVHWPEELASEYYDARAEVVTGMRQDVHGGDEP